jgi:membrane-associated protease RseP (regulator of RpoE activity)
MSEWVGVGLFVLVVLLVIMVHESGHFLTAKAFGIKVEEFFVGFGPRLWSFRRGETEYGVKALLFGGYVRIAGMNPFEEPSPEEYPRTYGAKPAWQRAAVIFAGPVTHFFIAFLALVIFFLAIGFPNDTRPLVARVEPTLNDQPSPAIVAGLRQGDEIVEVDGRAAGSIDRVITYVRAHVSRPITMTVRRDGRILTVTATPIPSQLPGEKEPVGRLGVTLGGVRERDGPIAAVRDGAVWTARTTKSIVLLLGKVFGPSAIKRVGVLLFGNAQRAPTDPTSIIGAGRLAGQAAQQGAWDALFWLIVVFNVFIGILNLVPLPPLDGGHLAVLVYEKVRGRKPDPRKLIPLTTVVAGFIVLYAVAVSYLDIVKPIPSPFR